MRPAEQGFLLLTSSLGDPQRRPLTVSQFRILSSRAQALPAHGQDRELSASDLMGLGYGPEMTERILGLLAQDELLSHYLRRGNKAHCCPLSRISTGYPAELRQKLGLESPGCLWAMGDLTLLDLPRISLVGSRDIGPENRAFAWEAGLQAAKQGYALVSGNARGADRIAQTACLKNGGSVICVVADALADKVPHERILYLSEDGFDQGFSAQRALSRNRVIHALGQKTLVAQCGLRTGGTWNGTVRNLRFGWSGVFCFDDGSEAVEELIRMGASRVGLEELRDISGLSPESISFFDQ